MLIDTLRKTLLKLSCMTAIATTVCLPINAEEVKPEQAKPESLQQLREQLGQFFLDKKIPGAQLALFNSDGVYWTQSFGVQNKAQSVAVNNQTLFRGGSTSKTFIGLAIEQMVQQGKFELTDKLSDVAPEIQFENPWHATHPVRVIHLLEHTAGFDDMRFRNFYNESEPGISMLVAVNRDSNALKVRWQPGTRQAYSNPGYGILGHLIEKYSGRSFEQYVDNEIIKPLGMQHSTLQNTKKVQQSLSQGFVDGEPVPYRDIYLRAAGSLHTNAQELAMLGQYLLSRGASATIDGINANVIQSMERPQTTLAAQAGLDYGYGRAIYHATRGDRVWYGHNGGIDGFLTSFGYSPALNQGYALMVNTTSAGLRDSLELITSFLAKDAAPINTQTVSGIDPEIAGYYRMANDRNHIFAGVMFPVAVIKVSVEGDSLVLDELIGSVSKYHHIGGQRFALEGQQHARMIFMKNGPDGKAFEVDGSYLVATNAIAAWLPLIMLTIISFVMVLTLVYFPVWLFNACRGKLPCRQRLKLRLFPLLSALCLLVVVIALFNLSITKASAINWQTLAIMLGSLVFPLFAAVGLYQAKKAWTLESNSMARYLNSAAAVSGLLLALYLWQFNYIGLSLWSW